MKNNRLQNLLFGTLSFGIPLTLYFLTSSDSLMFDDAAEFATVIRLGSIAHPPGTPAYILSGMIWLALFAATHWNEIVILTLFSSFCSSLSGLLLFVTFRKFLSVLFPHISELKKNTISFSGSLAYTLSLTAWAWSNTIEVYAFQGLAMALALYGLTGFHLTKKTVYLLAGALGLASGLGNHHLTMILFLPFVPFFFFNNMLVTKQDGAAKPKKKSVTKESFFSIYINVFRTSPIWKLALFTAIITLSYYGWMYYRSQQEYLYMFGKTDTISSLLYHISGGGYSKNISHTSGNIISARLPFFLRLTFFQFLFFIPFLIAGFNFLLRSGRGRFAGMLITYFLFLFVYQLNNNQWASTDAYLLLPYMLLVFSIVAGMGSLIRFKWVPVAGVLCVIVTVMLQYGDHNRKTYPVSKGLMHLLDVSAPVGSTILISDWTTVMQYYYYRIAENFRPDLVVLNYDVKFTHYRILPLMYPGYYQKIKKEYDTFIGELAARHPNQIQNTGCDLDSPRLMEVFGILIRKMEQVAKEDHSALLTDPKAHFFYVRQGFYSPNRFVSGCFTSTVPGDSLSSAEFLKLDPEFLKSPLLFNDPGALDKLVDFQAMLDLHLNYYKANHMIKEEAEAEQAKARIMKLQREMKRHMSFAYKIK